MILLAAVHQTLMTKVMIRKALRNAILEESLGDQSQGLDLARSSEMIPLWSQSRENSSKVSNERR